MDLNLQLKCNKIHNVIVKKKRKLGRHKSELMNYHI